MTPRLHDIPTAQNPISHTRFAEGDNRSDFAFKYEAILTAIPLV